MKPKASATSCTATTSFNILYGSKRVEALNTTAFRGAVQSFNILYGSKRVEAKETVAGSLAPEDVSISSTDRSGLKLFLDVEAAKVNTGFNILYGSKRVEANSALHGEQAILAFQYPLRIEAG